MPLILDKPKAIRLLNSLDVYCKDKDIRSKFNKSQRLLWIAKEIINRYNGVVLEENSIRYLCNNPKYLKKWAMYESLKNITPLKSTYNI